jgi:DNA-binding FadR family transcriptional regulator
MLVDCIAVGDTDEAAKVMRAHIDTSLGATAGWRLGTTPLGE